MGEPKLVYGSDGVGALESTEALHLQQQHSREIIKGGGRLNFSKLNFLKKFKIKTKKSKRNPNFISKLIGKEIC